MAQIISSVDDVDFAAGKQTPAEHTGIPLQLGSQACELDLTEAHLAELAAMLAPWFKVSHAAGLKPPRPGAGRFSQHRQRNARLRAWCDERGISYRNADGKVQYGRKLLREFEEWEAEHGQFAPPAQ